ncbi:MAG: hypothetical protein K8R21_14870 [Leptospira sp.]|nr:hypothetical protein [Leptospira sp.]
MINLLKPIQIFFYGVIVIMLAISCSEKKEKELKDDSWREESQKIASVICDKFQACSEDIFKKIKPSLKKYAESEIRSDRCTEKNKKSRVFLLKGFDPEFIKKTVRSCFESFQKLSCSELKADALSKIESCQVMEKIQKGEKI